MDFTNLTAFGKYTGIEHVQIQTYKNLIKQGHKVIPIVFYKKNYWNLNGNLNLAGTEQKSQVVSQFKLIRKLFSNFPNFNVYLLRFAYGVIFNYFLGSWIRNRYLRKFVFQEIVFDNEIFVQMEFLQDRKRINFLRKKIKAGELDFRIFVHDIIPLVYDFKESISLKYSAMKVLKLFDLNIRAFTSSEYVKNELYSEIRKKSLSFQHERIERLYIPATIFESDLSHNCLADLDLNEPFIYISSYITRKNHLNILKSFYAAALIDGKRRELVFIGRSNQISNHLTDYHNNQEYNSVILHQISFLDNCCIDKLYKLSKCVVYLSLNEGYGLPIIEGSMRGKKILCSNTSSMRELGLKVGATLVDPSDINAISRAICAISNDGINETVNEKEFANSIKWSDFCNCLVKAH